MAISKRFIGSNQVDGSKIKLLNNQAVRANNAAGTAVDLFKFDSADKLVFSKVPEYGFDPASANELTRKSYVDGQVAGVEGDLQALENRVDTAEGAIDAVEAAIDVLNGNSSVAGSVDKKVADAINGILNGVDGAYDTLKEIADYIEGDAAAGAAMLSQLGDHESRLDTLEGQNLDSRLTTAEGNISTAQGDIDALEGRMDTAEGEIDTLQSDASALESRVVTVEGQAAQFAGDIMMLQGDVSGLNTRMSDAENSIGILNTFMDAAGPEIAQLQTDVDAVEGSVSALDGRLTTAEGEIGQLQSDVSALQSASEAHQRIVLTSQMITNGYIDLAQAPKAGSTPKLLVYPDRLWLVPTDDFSRVNARITWNTATVGVGGEEALVAGDIVHVWYSI